MLDMVYSCNKLWDVFEALCNSDEFSDKLSELKLSTMDWRVLKSVIDFLK